ncbi:MAG: hypothetical protein HYY14_00550 [Candidatus Omnitrophica bacterium]|nr:hypothetical protein [Candidatus Omnitrophota bacterium]
MSTYPHVFTEALFLFGVVAFLTLWLLTLLFAKDPLFKKLVLASYLLRLVIALCFFFASYLGWPFLQELQRGNGFWDFAPDSDGHHYLGGVTADSWGRGGPASTHDFSLKYTSWVGGLYFLFGVNALYPIIFNCFMASLSGLFAYLIAKRFFNVGRARVSGSLVLFWPSTLIWSTQLLKDSVASCLIFASLLGVSVLSEESSSRRTPLGRILSYCVVALIVILMMGFRIYLGVAMAIAGIVAFVLPDSSNFFRRGRMWKSLKASGIGFLIFFSMTFLWFAGGPSLIFRASSQGAREDTVTGHVFDRFDELLEFVSLDQIRIVRRGYRSTGGHSLMDRERELRGIWEIVTYLPRALAIGFLAPFPWQWFDSGGSTGIMRTWSAPEMLLIYLISIPLLISFWQTGFRGPRARVFTGVFILILAVTMSLVVANLGILFRVRLQFLLPMLIFMPPVKPLLIRIKEWVRLIRLSFQEVTFG